MVYFLKDKFVLHNAPMAHLETQLLESVYYAMMVVLIASDQDLTNVIPA